MRKLTNTMIVVMGLTFTAMGFQNCGGSFETASQQVLSQGNNGTDTTTGDWVVSPEPVFVEGSGDTYNLYATLPSGLRLNGTFGVDKTSGPDLPAGMTLNPSTGIISVGTAVASTISGVVFTYTEPLN